MDAQALLQKHNPVLIILPEDTSRHRPGAVTLGDTGRGDYHPCAVELFLSLVVWRDKPKPWLRIPQDLPFVKNLPQFKEQATGLDEIKRRATQPGTRTFEWELDLAEVRSQNSRLAWESYANILERPSLTQFLGPVVYGRLAQRDDGHAILQYWYLYLYNDAPNKHEGDWEMACVELGPDEKPIRAGYSGHAGGYQRQWRDVPKEGEDRPIVYVARGSHAAYFGYRHDGYRTYSLPIPKGLPWPVEPIVSRTYDFLRTVWPFRDSVPALPASAAVDARERGVRLDITKVTILSEIREGEPPPEQLWWMRLNGLWGSRHARGFGVIGPSPPWQQGKWHAPWAWFESGNVRQEDADGNLVAT